MRQALTLALAALSLAAAPQRALAQGTPAVPEDSIPGVLRSLGLADDAARGKDRYVRGNVTIAASDTVKGKLVVIGGTAEILGVVTGNVHALWGDIVVHEGGLVAGNASAYRGSVVVDGGKVRGSMESWQRAAAAAVPAQPMSRMRALGVSAGWTAMLIIVGLVVLVLMAPNLERTARVLEEDFGRAFFIGVLGEVGFLPVLLLACVALALTIVGALLIPFVLVAAPVAFAGIVTLGWLSLALMAGRALSRGPRAGVSRNDAIRALAVGVVVLMLPWFAAAGLTGTGMVALVARLIALAIAWVGVTAGLGAALLSRAGGGKRGGGAKPQPPMQGWQTPTPISGVAAARRPVPARPGATPQ